MKKILLIAALASAAVAVATAHVGLWLVILGVAIAYAWEWRQSPTGQALCGAYWDLPAAAGVMKELYDGDQIVENDTYIDNPAYADITKKTNFVGKNYPVPLIYANPQGRSSTFATAQTNQAPTQATEFLLVRKKDYQLFTVDNETMEAMGSEKGAFVDYIRSVVDPAVQNITNSLASAMFRSGTGSIGQISTTVSPSTGVITLADPSSISQFEVNMVLQANATDGGASPRAALGYVIARDVTAGTITVATSGFGGSAASPSLWATSDYLLVQGDNNMKISGYPAWLLNAAPAASDNFYGVNRGTDRWRLAGGYYDASAFSAEEGIVNASNLLGREGSAPNICWISFQTYSAIELSLGAKVQYIQYKVGEIAFEGIKVNGPKGPITIMPDRNCPQYVGYLLKKNTWCLKSLGEAPRVLKYKDNLEMLRVANADAMEGRAGYYANMYCNAPGWSAQLKLSA